MKKVYFVLFSLLAGFIFTSCKLDGKSEATPEIGIYSIYTSNGDTLKCYYGLMDTITVGDTVIFRMAAMGYYNNLQQLQMALHEKKTSKFIWPEKQQLDTTYNNYTIDSISGRFYLDGTSPYHEFNFKYVALEETDEQLISIGVISDASQDYNSQGVVIKTPVKAKEENKE